MNQRNLNFTKNNRQYILFITGMLILLVFFTVMANLSYVVYRIDEESFEIVEAEIYKKGTNGRSYIQLAGQGVRDQISVDFRERVGDTITVAYSEDGIFHLCRCDFIISWYMVIDGILLIVLVIQLVTRAGRRPGSNALRRNIPRWERNPKREKPPWEL